MNTSTRRSITYASERYRVLVSEKRLAANRRNSFFAKYGGRAPLHYQCATIKKRTGERCKRWRLKGSKYCRKHGGWRMLGDGRRNNNPKPIFNGRCTARLAYRLPPLYSRYLTRTFSDSVHALMDMPPSDQFQLFEELALIRDAAGQSVKLYGIARDIADAKPDDVGAAQIAAAAAAMMVESLQHVVKVVDTAASIEEHAKDKISIHTLHHFVNQLVVVAHDVFGDDPRVEQFRIAVRDKVKVPEASNRGTTSLPSDDVAAMDASVPKS